MAEEAAVVLGQRIDDASGFARGGVGFGGADALEEFLESRPGANVSGGLGALELVFGGVELLIT